MSRKIPIIVNEIIEDRSIRQPGNPNYVKRYKRGKYLGKGGFAKCYEMTSFDSKRTYAGKVIPKASLTKSSARRKLLNEIKIHRSISHPHVVKFERFFEDSQNVYILLELCSKQTLMELVKRRKHITETETQYYMWQMLETMQHLHSHNIIHRDLKLGNLFLYENLDIKIGDFGLATRLDHPNERKRTICGTPNYIAPEILDNRNGHSFEVDTWSMGVIMYTLLIGKPPFETASVKSTYRRIRANSYAFPSHVKISNAAKLLITRILHSNPAQRPSLEEIRSHAFFTQSTFPARLPQSALRSPLKYPHLCHPHTHAYERSNDPIYNVFEPCKYLNKNAVKPSSEASSGSSKPTSEGHKSSKSNHLQVPSTKSAPVYKSNTEKLTSSHSSSQKVPPMHTQPRSTIVSNAEVHTNPVSARRSRAPLADKRNYDNIMAGPSSSSEKTKTEDAMGKAGSASTSTRPSALTIKAPRRGAALLRSLNKENNSVDPVSTRSGPVTRSRARAGSCIEADLITDKLITKLTPQSASTQSRLNIKYNTNTKKTAVPSSSVAAAAKPEREEDKFKLKADDIQKLSASANTKSSSSKSNINDQPDAEEEGYLKRMYDNIEESFSLQKTDTKSKSSNTYKKKSISPSSSSSASTSSQSSSSTALPSAKTIDRPASDLWVNKWVDYSNKYGLGYLLSNNNSGVYFNDSSKAILSSNNRDFEYIERRSSSGHGGKRMKYTLTNYPSSLQKKVTLLKHFMNYLVQAKTTDKSGGNPSSSTVGSSSSVPDASLSANKSDKGTEENMVYVKKWLRTKHAILFRLSNRTVQVIFYDHTEIVLSSENRLVTYTNKKKERNTYQLDTVFQNPKPDLARRMNYTKDILFHLLSRSRGSRSSSSSNSGKSSSKSSVPSTQSASSK